MHRTIYFSHRDTTIFPRALHCGSCALG
jgi:hypothetical protein